MFFRVKLPEAKRSREMKICSWVVPSPWDTRHRAQSEFRENRDYQKYYNPALFRLTGLKVYIL